MECEKGQNYPSQLKAEKSPFLYWCVSPTSVEIQFFANFQSFVKFKKKKQISQQAHYFFYFFF